MAQSVNLYDPLTFNTVAPSVIASRSLMHQISALAAPPPAQWNSPSKATSRRNMWTAQPVQPTSPWGTDV
jgi:hypothetical protein